jgi:hypothetical protein
LVPVDSTLPPVFAPHPGLVPDDWRSAVRHVRSLRSPQAFASFSGLFSQGGTLLLTFK